ncbi:MAG TPA: hypothetical protein VF919_11460 [Gemmatimonadales bacterium]
MAAGALEKLDAPARDVAELARRFEAQLEDGKVADRAALLAKATRALEGDSPCQRGLVRAARASCQAASSGTRHRR